MIASVRRLSSGFWLARTSSWRLLINEAMAKISANHYDAVICDIMMPQMKGDDFYRQATEIRPEFKSRFIFMTGFGNDPEVRCFLAKSGVKCLSKPFPVKKLIECVRELLVAPTPS